MLGVFSWMVGREQIVEYCAIRIRLWNCENQLLNTELKQQCQVRRWNLSWSVAVGNRRITLQSFTLQTASHHLSISSSYRKQNSLWACPKATFSSLKFQMKIFQSKQMNSPSFSPCPKVFFSQLTPSHLKKYMQTKNVSISQNVDKSVSASTTSLVTKHICSLHSGQQQTYLIQKYINSDSASSFILGLHHPLRTNKPIHNG